MLIAFNTSTVPVAGQVEVEAQSQEFITLRGTCQRRPTAPGSLRVLLAPLDFAICAAGPSP
jgi:hypothetical protein